MNQIIIGIGCMNPYDNVAELEKVVAEYGGSKYAVAVDSCTNALLLSLKYRFLCEWERLVEIPAHTYVGVAYSIINAGGELSFRDEEWKGVYNLIYQNIVDSARRFKKGMYYGYPGSLYCISCHWSKHLKIGRGGFILTDNEKAVEVLRIMRFDGRTAGVAPSEDQFIYPGHHCYMLPEEAARGLMLMRSMQDDNDDLPNDDYPDLREAFKYAS